MNEKVPDTQNSAAQDAEAELERSIGYQTKLAYRLSEKFIQKKLEEHHVPIGMWYFMRVLWLEDGLTQRELSRRTGTSEPTTLEQLRNMEAKGLIARRRSCTDRRKSIIVLTEFGRKLENDLIGCIEELNTAAFANFSSREIDQIRVLLRKLCENLKTTSK